MNTQFTQNNNPAALLGPDEIDAFCAQFRRDLEEKAAKHPNVGRCWYEAMGRVNKETKDVQDAIFAGKLWKGGHELYDLALMTTVLSMKMKVKPVLSIL